MSDDQPSVGLFSKQNFLSESLNKFLVKKKFKVLKNPKKILDIDYVIINLSSGLEISDFLSFISSCTQKCLVVVRKNQEELVDRIFQVNSNISVGVLSGKVSVVYDYSENILKELMSFGHTGKSFSLKGKEIKTLKAIPPTITPIKKVKKKKLLKVPNIGKKMLLVLMSVLLIFLIPAFCLLLSASALFVGVKNISTNQNVSEKFLNLSQSSADFVSVLNYNVSAYHATAEILDQAVSITKNVMEVIRISNSLTESITGSKIYNLSDVSTSLSAELDALYVNVGFLKGQIDSLNSFPLKMLRDKYLLSNIDLAGYSKKIYAAKELASRLDTLLGADSPKKYLVLFQNNMELRPTGGFIGSFALLTFDGGRLSDISVSDVYSADGQLKGHVEPPGPIKDILGEGGWYLRDANWDPDFPTSAFKIEWFLDKEINAQVDGVIAIDLHLVQNLLSVVGPIMLPDYSKVITSQNLYQTTQEEVESEFFPGSIKKASFLTALSRQLITELENLDSNKKPESLFKIYQSLEEGHIQIFVHDTNIQKIFNSLGYDGAVDVSTNCGLRCFWDRYYLVDANLGVNKANFYISRTQDLNLSLDKENISHELLVTYTNSANQILGNAGKYKTYTRLLVPQQSTVGGVRLYHEGGGYKDLEYRIEDINGRREVGFLLEVGPQERVRVQIAWKLAHTALSQGGEYRLQINKQPGTDTDLLGVTIKKSELLPSVTIPAFTLTGQGVYLYNTNLRQDFEAKIFVK